MDPVEVAIDRLRKQQARLALELGEAQAELLMATDPDEKRQLKWIIKEHPMKIDALAYALAFLRGAKEE